MLARNPNDTMLSNELNNETAENGALRKEKRTKYRMKYMLKTLQCPGRKPTSNQISWLAKMETITYA